MKFHICIGTFYSYLTIESEYCHCVIPYELFFWSKPEGLIV